MIRYEPVNPSMTLKDLNFASKQMIGFGLILLIMTIMNGYTLNRFRLVKEDLKTISTDWMQRVMAVSDINVATADLRNNQLQWAYAGDENEKKAVATVMINLIDSINVNLDYYNRLKNSVENEMDFAAQETSIYNDFDESWDEFQTASLSFFQLINSNDNEAAVALLKTDAQESYIQVSALLTELENVNREQAVLATDRAETTFSETRTGSIVLLALTILASLGIAGGLIRWITVPIRQLDSAAQRIALGDLNVELEIPGKDEIGSLSESFNKMAGSLRQTTDKLEQKNNALEKTSASLAKQKAEIESKNTELEDALEQLNRTQEQLLMKEKMASLGDLVAGVAHEINTPVGSVNSAADVLMRCLKKIEQELEKDNLMQDNPRLINLLSLLRDNIHVTTSASERITTIVKSLKNFARLDEAEYQQVDLHEGLNSSLTLLGSDFLHGIEIVKEYGDIPGYSCNPSQLNQVFINIIRNAVEAIDTAGKLVLRTELYQNGAAKPTDIRIQIADNGRGIAPENLDKLFDFKFSAGQGRMKLGSGLVSAYNIIQEHNGEIKVESQPGEGTTVSILLPLDDSTVS